MRILRFVIIFLIAGFFIVFLLSFLLPSRKVFINYTVPSLSFWKIRSIDTMKYSRDLSREKMNDPEFDKIIDDQVHNIAVTGATHVAIDTPYDEEFIPMLRRWVGAARKYNLNVWFRGNLSGWEKWFEYSSITRVEHTEKIRDFIANNPELFLDGDIFSSCPECENGGPGDPRQTGDVAEYRKFLISEYQVSKSAFQKIGKKIDANYFSMNGDVARLVMNKETTKALGGIVVIDHYVETPEKLLKDAEEIAIQSGGKIILGEFGAPIPDIHGEMTPEEQAQWIQETLILLANSKDIIGVNYWLNVGGTTEIWDNNGDQYPAAEFIRQFYKPEFAYGIVTDNAGDPINNAKITNQARTSFTNSDGYFEIPFVRNLDSNLAISAKNYLPINWSIEEKIALTHIEMAKEHENILLRIKILLKNAL